jgi:zinc/manganese transport system substrate-binding protein
VTSSILGDVVTNLAGDDAEVEVLMPPGADPHDFSPSARQGAAMRAADVLVTNGGGFEAGLDDAIDSARSDGVTVYEAVDAVDTLPAGEEAHADEEPDEHDEGIDPHVFTDPARMATIAEDLAAFLADEVPALDTDEALDRARRYVEELRTLDAETEDDLGAIPAERRLLVTNHDVFSYFAERYDFEIVGVIIPGGTTLAEPSAEELADLAADVDAADAPAIFAETSSPDQLAEALAREVGDIEIVELYTESLGDAGSGAESYIEMVRTNVDRIVDALS